MSKPDYSIQDIEKVVQGIDGQIKRVDISRLTAPGENFLSLVFKVNFEVEKNGQTKTVSTVAKRLPVLTERAEFNATGMRNEIKFYSELLPIIKREGKELGLDTDYYPKYLGGRLSLDPSKEEADAESVLLLENLNPEGFQNVDRHVGFDLPTIKTLLKKLAVYHSIPMLIKLKKPELFKTIKDFLERYSPIPPSLPGQHGPPNGPGGGPPHGPKGGPPDGPPMNGIFENMVKLPSCQPYLANIEVLKSNPGGPMTWHKQGVEPWNTIIHIDYWVNNIMLKFSEGQEPLVRMVDFQFYSYASFTKDVIFLLLTSVRNDVQRQYFDDLLRYYYDELTTILNESNIPQLKLSYETYQEELKKAAIESEVTHAIFFTTVIFGDKGTVPDFLAGEGDMLDHIEHMNSNMSERQKEKLGIIMELCAARGWLL